MKIGKHRIILGRAAYFSRNKGHVLPSEQGCLRDKDLVLSGNVCRLMDMVERIHLLPDQRGDLVRRLRHEIDSECYPIYGEALAEKIITQAAMESIR